MSSGLVIFSVTKYLDKSSQRSLDSDSDILNDQQPP